MPALADNGLGPNSQKAITWTNNSLVYIIYILGELVYVFLVPKHWGKSLRFQCIRISFQIIISSAPSQYLNQCSHIVNWTIRNKLQPQWNFFYQNTKLFSHRNTFQNVVCKMSAIFVQFSMCSAQMFDIPMIRHGWIITTTWNLGSTYSSMP